MNKIFILFGVIIALLTIGLHYSCRKDTSPIGNDDRPKRPTTGDAILTGHLYYDNFEKQPAVLSTVFIYFFDDYTEILATTEVDSEGKYYIENLPEDTVDIVIAQPWFNDILLAGKIVEVPLDSGINVADKKSIYTHNYIINRELISDHFMVRFDSTYSKTDIDSFNNLNNILSVSDFKTLNGEYSFLEIDPGRDILSLIRIYQSSSLTNEAGPVFYSPFRVQYDWSGGKLHPNLKSWVNEQQVNEIAAEYNLRVEKSTLYNFYHMYMQNDTKYYLEELQMRFYFHPYSRTVNVSGDNSEEDSPPPWE